jgi:hypothetical protein
MTTGRSRYGSRIRHGMWAAVGSASGSNSRSGACGKFATGHLRATASLDCLCWHLKLTVRTRNQLQRGEVAGLNLQRQPCVGPVPVWRPSSLPPSSPKRSTRGEARAVSADKLISVLTIHFHWLNPIVTRRLPDARRGMEGTCRTSRRVPSPSTLATWCLNRV